MESSQNGRRRWAVLLAWGVGTGVLLSAFPAGATDAEVPWECSGYTGEAQARCVRTLIEIQGEKIAKLEGQLKAQQDTVAQLKEQVDRQTAAASQERQSAPPPVTVAPVIPYAYPYWYAYSYGYPSVGFSLYLGSPWIYGPPYFGPSFNFYRGPRLFGHRGYWDHRW
ncbi:MAG: hypothetical protein AB1555_06600 [Nitrospirota bacterium]